MYLTAMATWQKIFGFFFFAAHCKQLWGNHQGMGMIVNLLNVNKLWSFASLHFLIVFDVLF